MSLLTIIGIALGLAMDAFAVAVATSIALTPVSGRQVFRFAFHFGLFQAFMPIIGWLAGSHLSRFIAAWDHWAAFALLTFVGTKAIYQAFTQRHQDVPRSDPTRGWSLVLYSTATSIDALAVGLSLGFLDVRIWYPCILIGCITAALTTIGMLIGSRLGSSFGKRLEVLGGFILIVIGLKILLEHVA